MSDVSMSDDALQWRQISFVVTDSQKEVIEDLMLEYGAVSITEESGDGSEIFQVFSAQQAKWEQVKLTVLFNSDVNLDDVNNAIIEQVDHDALALHHEVIKDEDWHKRWLSQFKPIKITDTIWICPSWITPPNKDATNIMIDPGMAFGTGTHETTKDCLQMLAQIDLQDKSVIDYGCGSGILSIAAKKLGAEIVHAIDIDAKALLVTRENCLKNNIDSNIELYLPDEFEVLAMKNAWQADVVIANILSETLIELRQTICEKIKPGGVLILSGILEDQANKIMTVYNEQNSHVNIKWQQSITNNWVTLLATT